MPETNHSDPQVPLESTESFDQLLTEYERSHSRTSEDGARQIEGTVVAVTTDAVAVSEADVAAAVPTKTTKVHETAAPSSAS